MFLKSHIVLASSLLLLIALPGKKKKNKHFGYLRLLEYREKCRDNFDVHYFAQNGLNHGHISDIRYQIPDNARRNHAI